MTSTLEQALIEYLYEMEIESVHASFDGCGDSGQIDELSVFSVNGDDTYIGDIRLMPEDIKRFQELDDDPDNYFWRSSGTAKTGITLLDLIEHVFYEKLELLHGGWEIDAGSSGDIDLTIEKDKTGRLVEEQGGIEVDICWNEEYEEDYD